MSKVKDISNNIYDLLDALFKIDRTILGSGFEKSLKQIKKFIPLEYLNYPSGTKVESWKILEEWKVNKAFIKNSSGKKIINYEDNPMHLWQYSRNTKKKISKSELEKHLSSKKSCPNSIPHVVAFYSNDWGFSLSQKERDSLSDDTYEVEIDVEFKKSNLKIGNLLIPGQSKKEILIDSVLSCPSLANNLSGPVIATFLAKYLNLKKNNFYSYRFLFTPETIGPLTFGIKEKEMAKNIEGGLTLINLGDKTKSFNYKKSRKENSIVDKSIEYLSLNSRYKIFVQNFDLKTGTCGNEKAFNSLGIEIPVGRLCRKILGSYNEYDTSFDDLSLISKRNLLESYEICIDIIEVIERNKIYKNNFKGEPFLTSYGLLPKIKNEKERLPYDYLMGFCDGKTSLLDIAEKSGVSIFHFDRAVEDMIKANLIEVVI